MAISCQKSSYHVIARSIATWRSRAESLLFYRKKDKNQIVSSRGAQRRGDLVLKVCYFSERKIKIKLSRLPRPPVRRSRNDKTIVFRQSGEGHAPPGGNRYDFAASYCEYRPVCCRLRHASTLQDGFYDSFKRAGQMTCPFQRVKTSNVGEGHAPPDVCQKSSYHVIARSVATWRSRVKRVLIVSSRGAQRRGDLVLKVCYSSERKIKIKLSRLPRPPVRRSRNDKTIVFRQSGEGQAPPGCNRYDFAANDCEYEPISGG